MVEDISIYLAGKIQKAHEDPNETYWTEADQQTLRKQLAPRQVNLLNPAIRSDDLSDQKSVFGRDMAQVFCADVVLVDARERRGLGVGAEMMWAKMNGIPVVAYAPLDSHYHKKNTNLLGIDVKGWVHPFVENLSDAIVDTLEEAASAIAQLVEEPGMTIRGRESIEEAMRYYFESQYESDEPMLALSRNSEKLSKRLEEVMC